MDKKRFSLRIDEKLFNEITNSAIKNRRSIAKEIEMAIDMYLQTISEKNKNTDIAINNIGEKNY